jgi:hypothetical protein
MKKNTFLLVLLFFSLISTAQLQGIYSLTTTRLTTGSTHVFSGEIIDNVGNNQYNTSTTGHFYLSGSDPGTGSTVALPVVTDAGFNFIISGANVTVVSNNLANYYYNLVDQNPSQYAMSSYNSATGIIVIEYTIHFNAGNQDYRGVYTPITLNNTSIDNYSFSFYPNPVKDFLNINLSGNNIGYKLYNILGKELVSRNTTDLTQIDMSDFEKGVYVLEIIGENNKVKNIKIVKD